jgi:hypothetical protein
MRDRGYPIEADRERRIEDLSVEHAKVMDNYRLGSEIAAKNARSEANTEDLRRAMVSYRTLFADLVGTDTKGDSIEERIVDPRSNERARRVRA